MVNDRSNMFSGKNIENKISKQFAIKKNHLFRVQEVQKNNFLFTNHAPNIAV